MEGVAEGLWELADLSEKRGEISKAVKCLEAICQSSSVSFLPIVIVKTRLRIATLLLKHSHNFRCYSLLSQCYHLVGAIPSQKQILTKALTLSTASSDFAAKLWSCNFNSQLANALIIQGDYQASLSALEHAYVSASEMHYPELQMFFATSILHVHLMQWDDVNLVDQAVNRCNVVWDSIEPDKRLHCHGLLFYNELLHIFYLLRICDYKNATQHVDKLDAAMKADLQKMKQIQALKRELDVINQDLSCSDPGIPYRDRLALNAKQAQVEEQLSNLTGHSLTGKDALEPAYFGNVRREWGDKLELAQPPIEGEWLPKSAVYALVDLMVVVFSRPKGLFKECVKRIQSGVQNIEGELARLGVNDSMREVDIQHSAIWMAGVYLMLLMQFLENKVAVELTRSEFVEAQKALLQMKSWYVRFPTILQACGSIIEMLRGQYSHSVGCYSEAAFHFIEASKLTESKSLQAMCHVYAAVAYICIGDAESSSQALDLIGPVYSMVDSFVGVREKTAVLFAYGFLLMKQQNLQEARLRLANGLQTTHVTLGNLQLVAQYLTVLGNLALSLHDTGQAREILRSSLTLAKKLYDIPTQIWVLSNMTALYQQLDEKGNEIENSEYQRKKEIDLEKRIADAHGSIHHTELVERVKVEVYKLNDFDMKPGTAEAFMGVNNLDIPESVGLSPSTRRSSARLMDIDIGTRGKRKV
ncbi:hypothetical protein DCAR_0314417 [Daucus carota subsp. sativus]|uniref:Sister chromatid cohesion protein SCC4 n=1 Tax=Daucus carota subsp. sativus TaxID=79200 RepID=A0AAF1AWR8_DAUCS|nr:hypothetical protein DCAR_0314417 [Daucus carota subsp. sativus]